MDDSQAKASCPPIWTIYNQPSDYPAYIVVRRWFGEMPSPDVKLFEIQEGRLDEAVFAARCFVNREGGDFCLERVSQDDPCIVESWI